MMVGKLIRDNVPMLAQQKNESCEYAVAQTQEAYYELLREKLVDTVNAFLNDNSGESLAEILAVLNALININPARFAEIYKTQMETYGGYTNKLILLQQATLKEKDLIEEE